MSPERVSGLNYSFDTVAHLTISIEPKKKVKKTLKEVAVCLHSE